MTKTSCWTILGLLALCGCAPTVSSAAPDEGPLVRASFEFKGCAQPGTSPVSLLGGGILVNEGSKPLTVDSLELLGIDNIALLDTFLIPGVTAPGGLESTYPNGFKYTNLSREQWDSRIAPAGAIIPPGGSVEIGFKVRAADPGRTAHFEDYLLKYHDDAAGYADVERAGIVIGDQDCWRTRQ